MSSKTKRVSVPKINQFTQKQILSYIRMKLATDRLWAESALLLVYDKQSVVEKSLSFSMSRNGIGFSKYDCPLLSHMAKKIRSRRELTFSEIDKLFHIIPKYCRQIAHFSDVEKLRKCLQSYYPDQSFPLNEETA